MFRNSNAPVFDLTCTAGGLERVAAQREAATCVRNLPWHRQQRHTHCSINQHCHQGRCHLRAPCTKQPKALSVSPAMATVLDMFRVLFDCQDTCLREVGPTGAVAARLVTLRLPANVH